MTEPRPVLTMLVQDKHGRWHIAIDGGYVYKEDAIRALEFYTTQTVQPTQTLEAVGLAVKSGEWAWERQDRGLAVTVAALLDLVEDALGRARVVTERLVEVESDWDAGGDEERSTEGEASA